jgi:hypothetical protein
MTWKWIRNDLEMSWKWFGNELGWVGVGNDLEMSWKWFGNELENSLQQDTIFLVDWQSTRREFEWIREAIPIIPVEMRQRYKHQLILDDNHNVSDSTEIRTNRSSRLAENEPPVLLVWGSMVWSCKEKAEEPYVPYVPYVPRETHMSPYVSYVPGHGGTGWQVVIKALGADCNCISSLLYWLAQLLLQTRTRSIGYSAP